MWYDMTLKYFFCYEFQAKIVAEAANGPVTPLAETILEDNDVVILPDLLLNAVSFSSLFYWRLAGTPYYL